MGSWVPRWASKPAPPRMRVGYRDRQSGTIIAERVASEALLRWFYRTSSGFWLFDRCLNSQRCNRIIGSWLSRPLTRRYIAPFVERYNVDMREAAAPANSYTSFNAFFARRLKPGARSWSLERERLCAPADGKVMIYAEHAGQHTLPVKGAAISKHALLGPAADAAPYAGGAALVIRLAPYDYHRFHFFDDAIAGAAYGIRGSYHSVNPIALARLPRLYTLNTRAVTLLQTRAFGNVAYVEVGAFAVGSIVQTYAPGAVRRGQEKGYFQFGGSTIVLLFEPGRLSFDDDLVHDSAAQREVQVRAGMGIGFAAAG